MLRRGMFVILNDVDAPEARMVAVLTSYNDLVGFWRARYLSTFTHRATCIAQLWTPTPLETFGVRLVFAGDRYQCIPIGPSRAAYEDGKPRRWQDRCPGRWHPLRDGAAKLAHQAA